ncbi:MAG: PilN domain-containing protein [Pseudoxanthomonas sp.]
MNTVTTPANAMDARAGALLGRVRLFLSWWKRSLLQCLPRSWRRVLGLGDDRVLVYVEHASLVLDRDTGDAVTALVELPAEAHELPDSLLGPRLAALPRWAVLPSNVALRRTLRLPAAAAPRLRDVVGFEIDRQTPFTADAVHYDARILGWREDGRLDVELVVVPRAQVQRVVAQLTPVAGELAGVDVFDEQHAPLRVNLLPLAQQGRRGTGQRGISLAFMAVALVSLLAAASVVLDNRGEAADALEAQVRSRAESARVVATRRQQLVDMIDGSTFLAQRRTALPATLQVLDELTRRLPDGTYLEKVSIEGNRLLVIGLSSEAASLVGRMEGAPYWRNPALSGALQPDPRVRRDRFSLVAELVPPPRPRPTAAARPTATAPAQEARR